MTSSPLPRAPEATGVARRSRRLARAILLGTLATIALGLIFAVWRSRLSSAERRLVGVWQGELTQMKFEADRTYHTSAHDPQWTFADEKGTWRIRDGELQLSQKFGAPASPLWRIVWLIFRPEVMRSYEFELVDQQTLNLRGETWKRSDGVEPVAPTPPATDQVELSVDGEVAARCVRTSSLRRNGRPWSAINLTEI